MPFWRRPLRSSPRSSTLRRALQRCGTKNAKRHLRRLRGRQRRFRRNCDHVLSKQIISCAAPGAVIVVEDLTGIRGRVRHRHGKQNRRFHSWCFARLVRFIAYKAEERGCTVATVNPRRTSQRCSRCGHLARTNRRSRAWFRCQVRLHAARGSERGPQYRRRVPCSSRHDRGGRAACQPAGCGACRACGEQRQSGASRPLEATDVDTIMRSNV